jgi:hypothetical protein
LKGVLHKHKNLYSTTKNLQLIFLINNSSNFDLLETDKYDVFLSGEMHTSQKNFDLQMGLIKHLSKNANLKYILAEDSFSNSHYIKTLYKLEIQQILTQFLKHLEGPRRTITNIMNI